MVGLLVPAIHVLSAREDVDARDAAAHARHGQSEGVKRFESVYSPESVGGDVVFTDHEMIAGKR